MTTEDHENLDGNPSSELQQQIESLPRNYLDLYSLYSIAEHAFLEYQQLLVQAVECDNNDERTQYNIRRLSCRDIVIVFSQLFLEASIYDYGATNTSDTFMKKYVNKLDFLSKWVLIPKLITGKDFPTDSEAYELLVKLKKARNDLVHFKTRKLSGENSPAERLRMLDGGMRVEECFNCMSESLSVLKRLDSQKWPLFGWAFIERLMSKSHNDIRELAVERIRSALGIKIQTDDKE